MQPPEGLFEAILDSWDRNNTILTNLLSHIPEDLLDLTPAHGSMSIARMFTHMHFTRLFFVSEDAPEFAMIVENKSEAFAERNPDRIARMLTGSAKAVRDAVSD